MFDFSLRPLRLMSVLYEVTPRCNLSCDHCYNVWKGDRGHFPGELDTNGALRLIAKAVVEGHCDQLTLTGGEPCLREDLEDLVAFAKTKVRHVVLISNGTLLGEGRVRSLLDAGVDLFELPMHGGDPATHDEALGCAGSFDRVTRAAVDIHRLGGQTAFVFVGKRSAAPVSRGHDSVSQREDRLLRSGRAACLLHAGPHGVRAALQPYPHGAGEPPRAALPPPAQSAAMQDFMAARPAFCMGCLRELECQGGCKAAAEACCGDLSACEPFLADHRDRTRVQRIMCYKMSEATSRQMGHRETALAQLEALAKVRAAGQVAPDVLQSAQSVLRTELRQLGLEPPPGEKEAEGVARILTDWYSE